MGWEAHVVEGGDQRAFGCLGKGGRVGIVDILEVWCDGLYGGVLQGRNRGLGWN